MKIVAFVQARMSSNRLPNKVLKTVCGLTLVNLIYQRLSRSKLIDQIVLLTSIEPEDDELALKALDYGYQVFRGSLDDVLDRFYQASNEYAANYYVRITADCPLIDSEIVDMTIKSHIESRADYTSNAIEERLPDGLDVEVFNKSTLLRAHEMASKDYEREHVTYVMYSTPDKFKINAVDIPPSLEAPGYRLTVDEEADLLFINSILSDMNEAPIDCSYREIKHFLDSQHEGYFTNRHIGRNEGLKISIEGEINA